MDTSQIEIKNIQKLLQEDPYIKPYEKEIRRRYDSANLIKFYGSIKWDFRNYSFW